MVAVSIIAISVAAPTYGASRALTAAQNANSQLTASYLAQEGIEYARVARDSYYLAARTDKATASSNGWDAFNDNVVNFCTGSAGCSFDSLNPSFTACGSSCPKLNLRKSTGEYTTQTGSGLDPTIYTRTIKMSSVTADEVEITSTVSWSFHDTTHRVEIVSRLTRWLP